MEEYKNNKPEQESQFQLIGITQVIPKELKQWIFNFEKTHLLKFILLVETGARGRGCETKNSDFDLKGFYIAENPEFNKNFVAKKDKIKVSIQEYEGQHQKTIQNLANIKIQNSKIFEQNLEIVDQSKQLRKNSLKKQKQKRGKKQAMIQELQEDKNNNNEEEELQYKNDKNQNYISIDLDFTIYDIQELIAGRVPEQMKMVFFSNYKIVDLFSPIASEFNNNSNADQNNYYQKDQKDVEQLKKDEVQKQQQQQQQMLNQIFQLDLKSDLIQNYLHQPLFHCLGCIKNMYKRYIHKQEEFLAKRMVIFCAHILEYYYFKNWGENDIKMFKYDLWGMFDIIENKLSLSKNDNNNYQQQQDHQGDGQKSISNKKHLKCVQFMRQMAIELYDLKIQNHKTEIYVKSISEQFFIILEGLIDDVQQEGDGKEKEGFQQKIQDIVKVINQRLEVFNKYKL